MDFTGADVNAGGPLASHQNLISCVAFNRDCTLAISGSGDGTVAVWDTATSACKRLLSGHKGYVRRVALTAVGDIAVSVEHPGDDNSVTGGSLKVALVWDVASGKCIGNLPGKWAPKESIGFSPGETVFTPDGRIVLIDGKGIRAWDVTKRRYLHVDFFDNEGKGHSQALAVAERSGKSYLLIGGFEELRLCVLKPSSEWNSSEYAPLSKRCLFDHEEKLDVTVPNKLWAVGNLGCVAISDDGGTAASHSHDGIRIWKMPGGSGISDSHKIYCTKHIPVESAGRCVALSPDGKLVVSEIGSDMEAGWYKTSTRRVWDTSTGQCIRNSEPRTVTNPNRDAFSLAMRFAPGGTRILFGTRPNATDWWDVS